MSMYRCYFLDAHDCIRAAEDFDADALPDAIERARAMLRGRAHHHAIEVWQGSRRLYTTFGSAAGTLTAPAPAAPTR